MSSVQTPQCDEETMFFDFMSVGMDAGARECAQGCVLAAKEIAKNIAQSASTE